MLTGWFMWFILIWSVVLSILMGIGGYFMFRKFLKKLPKADGKSVIDWEEYYIQESLHLWGQQEKELLYELVDPVPSLFRDVAKQKIASKIAEIALRQKANKIETHHIVQGYIQATPKRDHPFLRKCLKEKNIDVQPYEQFF